MMGSCLPHAQFSLQYLKFSLRYTMGNMFGMFLFAFWVIRALECEAVNFLKFESAGTPIRLIEYLDTSISIIACVEKLQFSLLWISCSQGILNASWLSWYLILKIACLHVSFTAYENFYKLSKMYCLLVLTFHFPIIRISEYRNPTIKHICTYTLISLSIG